MGSFKHYPVNRRFPDSPILAKLISFAPYLLPSLVRLTYLTHAEYENRPCQKCGLPMLVIPRVSRRYFGKTDVKLCTACRRENKKASIRLQRYRRKMRRSVEVRDETTHSTPKRRRYQEGLDTLLNFVDEELLRERVRRFREEKENACQDSEIE